VSNELLPVLAQREDMRIVEVDGQPVVTARDLARALGYAHENAVVRLFNRNRESFKEVRSQIDSGVEKYDTGEIEIQTPAGARRIRYFTKRGALKICMKSNQPKAVAVQEALIDLYEQVERGDLVSVGYLRDVVRELKSEVRRLSEMITAAGLSTAPRVVYLPRPWKRHSFDPAALDFLRELFLKRPWMKTSEMDRALREEAGKKGWKVGSRASVYRAVAKFRDQ